MADIDSATTELNNAWQAASQDMYNAQQNAQQGPNAGAQSGAGANGTGAGGGQSQAAGDNNVTDVDFEEVK